MPAVVVTPANLSEARQNLSDGLVAVLNGIHTANPVLLKQVWPGTPAKIVETPCAFLGNFTETIVTTSGTRQRIMQAEVWLVDKLIEPMDTANRMDVLVDLCVSWFGANTDVVTNSASIKVTALQQGSGYDTTYDESGGDYVVHYAAHVLLFGGPTTSLVFQEGTT